MRKVWYFLGWLFYGRRILRRAEAHLAQQPFECWQSYCEVRFLLLSKLRWSREEQP